MKLWCFTFGVMVAGLGVRGHDRGAAEVTNSRLDG